MKYSIDHLVIEVTRRCNMYCDHCLRGDAQNIDLDLSHVRELFKHVGQIRTLTLTGGEPSLVPHIIEDIVKEAEAAQVSIDRFYMVTNAKQVTPEFLKSVLSLYLYCDSIDDEAGSVLDISNDGHHEDVEPDNVKMLMAFRFTGKKSSKDGVRFDQYDGRNKPTILMEGRGRAYEGRNVSTSCFLLEDDDTINEAEFYMNVNGDVLGECNLSYESQDKLKIANVHDEDFDPMQAAQKWNDLLEPNGIAELINGEVSE